MKDLDLTKETIKILLFADSLTSHDANTFLMKVQLILHEESCVTFTQHEWIYPRCINKDKRRVANGKSEVENFTNVDFSRENSDGRF